MKTENLATAGALDLGSYIEEGAHELGPVVMRDDIRSAIGPFNTLPGYTTKYPEVVVRALFELYMEYNGQFGALVAANREWETDYQYCVDEHGQPLNRWVQIDMVGLPQRFLEIAPAFSVAEVREALRRWIFEIENSLAMYQLLERIIPAGPFSGVFRESLDELRQRHGKKIAILAVTNAKYNALKADEFDKGPTEDLTDAEVFELSGFDRLFGPDEFREHVATRGGECDYLLYVRSSHPVAKLKDPNIDVRQPLLEDPELRRVIKAHTLTMNIDDPAGSVAPINDTKGYMPPMGMAYRVTTEEDLLAPKFLAYLRKGRDPKAYRYDRLTPAFVDYLEACGVDPERIASGEQRIRAKPLSGTYGCYGHHCLQLSKGKARQKFRADLHARGTYLVQPELPTPVVVNRTDGRAHAYIDRNFVTVVDGTPVFMGGFRSMLPLSSGEAQKRRLHGNHDTLWAEIS